MMLMTSPAMAKDAQPLSDQDLEFLEFLGSWETEDGEWVNPIDFIEESTDESGGEKVFYDPKDEGEPDDGFGQTRNDDMEIPVSPRLGVETDD